MDKGEQRVDNEEAAEEVEEGRALPGARAPREPTVAEREEHDRSHWPRRPWCRFCTATGCVASPRGQGGRVERTKSLVSMDYCYPGAAERSVRTFKEHRECLLLVLEEKVGIRIPAEHPVLQWLTEYSAAILRRCRVGADGWTAFERLKGRGSAKPMPIFAERVMFRPLVQR